MSTVEKYLKGMTIKAKRTARWQYWLVTSLIIALLPILLPAVLLWLLITFVGQLLLLLVVWGSWLPRGKDLLVVYSNSPNWQDYFETGLIPRFEGRTIILNWSERSRWPRLSLSTLIFGAFAGERRFNPMLMIFKPLRWPRKIRFYDAFKQRKHGNEHLLRELEARLETYLA